jgi:hypothetical protein
MKKLLDKIPLGILAAIALLMSFAPFVSEPHLWQKLNMLFDGSLTKPIDIFDLFWHALPITLLVIKLGFMAADKSSSK